MQREHLSSIVSPYSETRASASATTHVLVFHVLVFAFQYMWSSKVI